MNPFWRLIVATGLALCACQDETVDMPVGIIPADHDIEVKSISGKAKFWNNVVSEEFVPRGVNYLYFRPGGAGMGERLFAVGEFNETQVRNDFKTLSALGYNTVRFFMDLCGGGPGCIGLATGGLNGDYIDNIVRTLNIAKDEGIYLMLTSNDLPADGGYWEISDEGTSDQFAGYRNGHYLTEKGVESAQAYWGDLLKAFVDKDAALDHVLAWSLLNEQFYFSDQPPFSLNSGTVTTAIGNTYDMSSAEEKKRMAIDGMAHYIDKVREVISKYDPNALVTMGFFAPDYPNPIGIGGNRYVETAGLLTRANLSFFDFHGYSGNDQLLPIAENFGMLGFESKPIIMGEFGAFLDRYMTIVEAVDTQQSWMAESCNYGFDGWLYWGLYRLPLSDGTWSFFDGMRELLDGLSPTKHLDPCDPALLLPVNVALNKSATASQSLPDQTPAKAVDGSLSSQWGAGDDAPQWIEIDLEADIEITKVNLKVAQFPAGPTVHVLEGKSSGGSWVTLKTFDGTTTEGDVLVWTPPTGGTIFRYVKVTTTASPSWVAWKEIEVFD